jgi:hypothetical protein
MLGALGAHPPMMEAEEVNALASLLEVHDPGLGVLELKPKLAEDQPHRGECRFGLLLRPAHHDQIVREPDQDSLPALGPLPVEPVQIDVTKARRYDCSHAIANFEFERSIQRRSGRNRP